MIVKDGMSSSLTFSNPIKFLHSFQQDPRFPGTSRCPPLWTAWSRPLRSREWYDNELEAFHVVREDGLVYYFHAEKGKTTELGRMAMFTGFVDQAFACCDVDTTLMKPFLLIAAGESSPGEVLSIGASRVDRLIAMAPQNLEVIHNWSPTLDMMISDLGHRSGPGSLHHRTAIYCTAMMGPEHGAVAEMNLGLEARPKVISEGEGFSGVTRIWALLVPSAPPERRESVALVLSMIEETAIIQLKPSTDPDQPYEQDESFDEDNCGLAFDRPTLAVAHLSGARMIQVTNESIQILHNTGSSPKQFSEVTFASSRPQNITCASVSEDAGTVLVALRVDPNFILRLVQIDVTRTLGSQENDNSIGEPFHLDSEPTAMAIFKVCATVHAVASTADGNLHILRRGERDTLLSCVKYSMARSEHASSPTICESLTVLHRSVGIDSDQLDSTCELVCGMRDGTILIVSLAPTISSRSLNDTAAVNGHDSDPISALSDIVVLGERWITLGITPVMVIPERPSKRNAAFAFCGRHLFRLTLPIDNAEDFHIDEVVSNHWGTPIPRNTPVSAVTPILNPLGLKHVSRDDIAMMCGSTLSLSTINLDRKPVPTLLRLRGQGTPNRLLYLDSLDCIAVASMRTKVLITHPPNQAWAGKRITRAQIEFVSTNLFDEDDKPLVLCTHKLSPGERILCMVDWKIIVSGKKYHYLLVGAELKDKDQNQTGLLRFLNMRRVKEDDMTRLDVNQSKQIQSSAPIYSIATLGETDIVFATGFWLKVLRFDSATKR